MRTSRAVAVTALMAVASLNFLAACTPEDDSDTLATPTPPPDPTPEPEFHCQVVWTAQNGTDGSLVDVFVLDAPEAAWIAGVNTFGEFTGFYQPGIDVTANHVDLALTEEGGVVTSTADSFTLTLTVAGVGDGADVTIADATENTLYGVGTDGNPTEVGIGFVGDPMDFDGVWSSRDATNPAEVDLGTGDVAVVLGTSGAPAINLGGFGSWAICYDAAAVAQSHPLLTTRHQLQRMNQKR